MNGAASALEIETDLRLHRKQNGEKPCKTTPTQQQFKKSSMTR
jgi:hypothetical protein